jgi:hypothetical protein
MEYKRGMTMKEIADAEYGEPADPPPASGSTLLGPKRVVPICYIHNVLKKGDICPKCEEGKDTTPALLDGPADLAYRSALSLATSMWKRHYSRKSPQWKPESDLVGLISQIDNMAAGLGRMADAMCEDLKNWQEALGGPNEYTQQVINDYEQQ